MKKNIALFALAPNGPEKWGCRTHVEWEFETYIVKFETYSVKRDYETKKTAGALEPPEPPSLAPMNILLRTIYIFGATANKLLFSKTNLSNTN